MYLYLYNNYALLIIPMFPNSVSYLHLKRLMKYIYIYNYQIAFSKIN